MIYLKIAENYHNLSLQDKLNFEIFDLYKESLKKELENNDNKIAIEALELIRKIEKKRNFTDLFFVNIILLVIRLMK